LFTMFILRFSLLRQWRAICLCLCFFKVSHKLALVYTYPYIAHAPNVFHLNSFQSPFFFPSVSPAGFPVQAVLRWAAPILLTKPYLNLCYQGNNDLNVCTELRLEQNVQKRGPRREQGS